MITRLDRLQGRDIYENTALAKINELVDKVNDLTTNLDGQARTLVEQQAKISILEEHAHPTATTKPADPYAEQRKWIGKLCKFWDYDGEEKWFSILEHIDKNSPYTYCASGDWWYKHCELVKPDDDIIYKGGDNE